MVSLRKIASRVAGATLLFLVTAAALPRCARAQGTQGAEAHAREASLLDLSGVHEFWHLADAYTRGDTRGDADWDRLFSHPGYAQLDRQARRRSVLERCVPLVFAPGNEPALEAVLSGPPTLASRVCAHLREVRDRQAESDRFASRLQLEAIYEGGIERAAAYLPAGLTAEGDRPRVHIMLFEQNGFGGESILLDLLRLMDDGEDGLVRLLGHELYHAYRRRLPDRLPDEPGQGWILGPLSKMQEEGIASMIDKADWVVDPERAGTGRSEDARATIERFAGLYASTPERLRRLDALVRDVADGTATPETAGPGVDAVIPFGGHATGMYMARSIEEALGRDALRDPELDPIGFVLEYQESVLTRGSGFRFSDEAVRWLTELHRSLRPPNGVDVTAVRHFFRAVDTLSAGIEPSERQWAELLATPGYVRALDFVPTVRRDIEVAFGASRSAVRDSLLNAGGETASRLRHLQRAATLRDEILALGDSLAAGSPVADAVERAAAYLPPHATEGRDVPPVTFALFRYDGYAGSDGVVIDLLYVLDNGLVPFLAHELHHAFAADYDRLVMPASDAPERQLVQMLSSLRTEGSADLVDKPHPLVATSAGLESYVRRYNLEYDRTPEVVQTLDSLLASVHDDPARGADAGRRARAILWSNAHPHGAYMARTIDASLGRETLVRSLENPFLFLRTFADAVRITSGRSALSPGAEALLSDFQRKYVR